ncbi:MULTISPECIES: RloB family protein [unclassified Microbispora]|uniref:RloB family protein n=1 Tax=unclassified Microbispora TaxID=2614687 RepID=UPI001F109F01|nr:MULTISPECIES: RloB family protein [unclassified Microbispora]
MERPSAKRDPKKRILVICEGVVTEVQYFNGVKDHFRAVPVEVGHCDVDGCGKDPLSVVREAIRRRDKARSAARRHRDAFLAYDEIWAVVDVDDHASLDEAIRVARDDGINLVISRPCFEIWLLWHYQDCPAALTAKEIQRKLATKLPNYDKHLSATFPYHDYLRAERRAKSADPDHSAPNRKGRNPSTNVWLVVNGIAQSGKREPVGI